MGEICERSERATENEKKSVSEEISNFLDVGLCDSQSPWLRASMESMRIVKGCIAKLGVVDLGLMGLYEG